MMRSSAALLVLPCRVLVLPPNENPTKARRIAQESQERQPRRPAHAQLMRKEEQDTPPSLALTAL